MKLKYWILLIVLLPMVANAHGPTRKKVTVERDINAAAAEVWSVVGDFAALDKWLPPVEKCSIVSGSATEAGAVRELLVGGKILQETLKSVDNEKRLVKYKMSKGDVSVLPVTNYSSSIAVKENSNGGSTVVWKGAFYRGYPNNDPPAELNDEAAIQAVEGLYNLGLDNLKTLLEK